MTPEADDLTRLRGQPHHRGDALPDAAGDGQRVKLAGQRRDGEAILVVRHGSHGEGPAELGAGDVRAPAGEGLEGDASCVGADLVRPQDPPTL